MESILRNSWLGPRFCTVGVPVTTRLLKFDPSLQFCTLASCRDLATYGGGDHPYVHRFGRNYGPSSDRELCFWVLGFALTVGGVLDTGTGDSSQ